ncbi:transmembrane amino acid transporter protein-domain-containing protein [Xylariaceae sp. FL1272]|nr:transmembrane amino acid transporter protein-domain-containing protein [Xylariaceae sp. FL1272]
MAVPGPTPNTLHGGDPSSISRQLDDERRTISFEEYMYYAAITRSEEKAANERFVAARGKRDFKNVLRGRFSKGHEANAAVGDRHSGQVEKVEEKGDKGSDEGVGEGGGYITSKERKTASRALRTASWGTIFYLITTDILGPISAPWVFAQTGYGPGIALYTVFGVTSCYSGWIIWKVYLGLDSDQFPLRGFGDFFYRLFGSWARHFVNIAQALQMFLTVAIIVLSNGQSISQISRGENGVMGICFVACLIIVTGAGLVLGQIRTLQRLGWLANVSVWLTVGTVILTMASVGYGPNYAAVEASFGLPPNMPIQTFAGIPPSGLASGGSGFVGSLNGVNVIAYAYGGAMLFAALLAEMRHPMDFWKGMIIAEVFIFFVYIFFGVFVYSFQGQYSYNPAMQGIANYKIQTAGNILNLFSNLIAAVLYSNIGLKVVYVEVCQRILGFPELTTKVGKIWWAALIPIYWFVAFIIAAAIPQFSYIVGLVGAIFMVSFTYVFPAWMALGFMVWEAAIVPEEERFDPATNTYNYIDKGWKRWARGFMKRPLFNSWNVVYLLGALVTSALGTYSAAVSIRAAFTSDLSTSLSCKPPL